jgi:hypothetical protein
VLQRDAAGEVEIEEVLTNLAGSEVGVRSLRQAGQAVFGHRSRVGHFACRSVPR